MQTLSFTLSFDASIEPWLRLRVPQVEKAFVQVIIDLKEILVLDGIDQVAIPTGFRIRSHDLFGSLPEIPILDTGDRYPVLERIENAAAKLIAIIRIRQDLIGIFPGCEFLLPTSTDEGAVVGMQFCGIDSVEKIDEEEESREDLPVSSAYEGA